ncbi:MAG: Dabb family protein [Nitrospinales bacterium]
MVKHVVMFKLAEKTPANMDKVVASLKGMEGNIETLRHLEVGVDFNGSERSFDVILTTHFDDRQGLKIYTDHKNHQPVRETMRALCSNSVVIDYETDDPHGW